MAYTEQHFLACKYNPMIDGFAEKHPDLLSCVPDTYKGDKEKLMRYVCFLYDPNSPLVRDTSSFEQRQRIAAQYAGFGDEDIQPIFDLSDNNVIEAIDNFIKNEVRERLWYMIQGNEFTFYEYGKRLLKPVIDDQAKEKDLLTAITIKTKISEDMAALDKRIGDDYKKLYADDINLIKAIDKKKSSPEGRATRIK